MSHPATEQGEAAPINPRPYEYFVDRGVKLRTFRDNAAWELGRLAAEFTEEYDITPGRPPKDDQTPTLSALAHDLDMRPESLGQFRLCHLFYPEDQHTDQSLAHHDLARRNSDGDLENALELLDIAKQQHMSAANFRQYLKGDYWSGVIDCKNWLQMMQGVFSAFVPFSAARVRITFSRVSEDE